jgi:hypothetical protein
MTPLDRRVVGILREVARGDVSIEEAQVAMISLLAIEAQQQYQRGYEDGRAAGTPHDVLDMS